MGKKQVTILDPATDAVAEAAYFIESKGMPETAKKFVAEVFLNFLPPLLMKGSNIITVLIRFGRTCIIVALLLENTQ